MGGRAFCDWRVHHPAASRPAEPAVLPVAGLPRRAHLRLVHGYLWLAGLLPGQHRRAGAADAGRADHLLNVPDEHLQRRNPATALHARSRGLHLVCATATVTSVHLAHARGHVRLCPANRADRGGPLPSGPEALRERESNGHAELRITRASPPRSSGEIAQSAQAATRRRRASSHPPAAPGYVRRGRARRHSSRDRTQNSCSLDPPRGRAAGYPAQSQARHYWSSYAYSFYYKSDRQSVVMAGRGTEESASL